MSRTNLMSWIINYCMGSSTRLC